jgi:hypothetical protein
LAAKKIKLNKNSVMEFLAGEVSAHAHATMYEITKTALEKTPIWSGQMVNSWKWSIKEPEFVSIFHNSLELDAAENPLNPLDRPTINEIVVHFGIGKKDFPTYYFTNGKEYAYKIDQGVGMKTAAYQIVSQSINSAVMHLSPEAVRFGKLAAEEVPF